MREIETRDASIGAAQLRERFPRGGIDPLTFEARRAKLGPERVFMLFVFLTL